MTVLGLMATFTPTRWLLRMHKRKVEDSSITEEIDPTMEQIPVFYVHGFRGGDYTTNKMVQAACEAKGTDKFLKATIDPFGNFILEGTWTADKQPIVQLIFKDRIAGVYASSYYLRAALSYLSKNIISKIQCCRPFLRSSFSNQSGDENQLKKEFSSSRSLCLDCRTF